MRIAPRVLLLATEEQQAAQLATLLAAYVDLTCVSNLPELEAALQGSCYDALFYLRPPKSAAWKQTLQEMRRRHPELPVIVLSDAAAVYECADIFNAGAFDLLVPPFGNQNLLAAVEQAVASTQARAWHAASALTH